MLPWVEYKPTTTEKQAIKYITSYPDPMLPWVEYKPTTTEKQAIKYITSCPDPASLCTRTIQTYTFRWAGITINTTILLKIASILLKITGIALIMLNNKEISSSTQVLHYTLHIS